MPHRSSYHGGEYRNTQSCPTRDCTKLVSDSEHLKEDKFAKEDPAEFTDDVAVKEKLTNWCSEDDTPKKRRRQHVARRLFSADDQEERATEQDEAGSLTQQVNTILKKLNAKQL